MTSFEKRALGKQVEAGDKEGMRFCVISGEEEAAAQKSSLKDLQSGEQIEVNLADLVEEVKRRLA